jgi:hypothetical protein
MTISELSQLTVLYYMSFLDVLQIRRLKYQIFLINFDLELLQQTTEHDKMEHKEATTGNRRQSPGS